MEKIKEFLKSSKIAVKWTIWYCVIFWCIMHFLFNFDIFSQKHWWKFFHSTFHGFGGFSFQIIMYSALPIYIATTISSFRKQEYIIQIPIINKTIDFIKSKFSKPAPAVKEETTETAEEEIQQDIYPEDLPNELRVPFMRAKNNQPFKGTISAYNKNSNESKKEEEKQDPAEAFPIPMDFDISETSDINTIPTFQDINFDTPIATMPEPEKLENTTTKYLDSKKIEYETFKDYVATEKYVICEHNDSDFWIMDEETWFASGKQKDSPIPELLSLAKENGLIPVVFFASQNIMDIETTTAQFEALGVRVIKSIEELY